MSEEATAAPRRIVVAGSVDHGKSTLLGRILLDCGGLPEDRVESVRRICAAKGVAFEPAFLLDAFKEEQDQGVTIDTTRVSFEREGRRYLLIDAPGHLDLIKNMATGASEAEFGILIVDAREGVRPQTVRHLKMLALLGVAEIVVAVNKMDVVGYEEAVFARAADELAAASRAENLHCLAVVPVAALPGENVSAASAKLPWHAGPPLLTVLAEAAERREDSARALTEPFRMPLQDVYRFDDARRFVGRVTAGILKKGETIQFSPSGKLAVVLGIEKHPRGDLDSAGKGDSVALRLKEQVFVERGEVISRPHQPPRIETHFGAKLAWFGAEAFVSGAPYLLKLGSAEVRCVVRVLRCEEERLANGVFADVAIDCERPIAFDDGAGPHALNKLVLCTAYETVAVGVVSAALTARRKAGPSSAVTAETGYVSRAERETDQRGAVLWLTGLPGSGKTTLARALERRFHERGLRVTALDGDNLRHGLNSDLGVSPEDRAENIRRVAHVARMFLDAGFLVIVACVSPYADDREIARGIVGAKDFSEIFVYCPLEVCQKRDPKGLYAKAASGEVGGFSGVSAPYQVPARPALRLDSSVMSVEEEVSRIEGLAGVSISKANMKMS
ncbi:MAG: adenylyl-sulfate kinase [Elusimicrobiota bacterium]